jgi:putative aldouronate transport system substrate-binding protein
MLNFTTVTSNSIDPTTKNAYNPQLWKSELAKTNALQKDWSAHMGGSRTAIQYLEKHHQLTVLPGVAFSAPEESSQLSAVRGQINQVVESNSWKAALATSDSAYDSAINAMISKADGFGFSQIEKVDMANINSRLALIQKLRE